LWQPDDLIPYVDHLLEAFGPGRLMFGSDWPVCTLAVGYAEVVALTRELLEPRVSPAERDAVFCANATAVYRLKL